jgi:hypothetical protein
LKKLFNIVIKWLNQLNIFIKLLYFFVRTWVFRSLPMTPSLMIMLILLTSLVTSLETTITTTFLAEEWKKEIRHQNSQVFSQLWGVTE